jgi:tetratricopeptide (TPR) repeat protein
MNSPHPQPLSYEEREKEVSFLGEGSRKVYNSFRIAILTLLDRTVVEKRFELYYQPINQLLACPDGEKLKLLQANSHLLDLGLLIAMGWRADDYAQNENSNAAEYLRSMAQGLVTAMGFNSVDDLYREYLNCLMQILTAVEKNPTAEFVYPVLASNREKLDLNLGLVLQVWAQSTLPTLESEQAQGIAGVIGNFGVLIQQFPWGNIANNLEITIIAYQIVLTVYTQTAFPQDWAMTQNNLGVAYSDRLVGDKAENIERAIECYENALQVRTQTAFPQDWAATQNNLGNAYSDRLVGDKAENLKRAIECYENALQVYTQTAFPQDWAATQNNLGTAYSDRLVGDKAENLKRAIECYENALKVYTQTAFPQDWAMTQNNLGNAYSNRLVGDQAENLKRAIECYENALKVRTQTAFPQDWAMTQNNLYYLDKTMLQIRRE